MKKILLILLSFFITQYIFSQGCTVTGSSPSDTIVCGERVLLSAFGQAQGNALLSENFNTGSYGPGWASTQQAMWNNPCSPGGVDGTTHVWMGNSGPVPRVLTTTSFNLSSCAVAGVTICFDMLFATQGNSAPCEGPDEPQEGIFLQYSIDNGATWININYFDPNGGNDPQLINWNNWCFPVPLAALTANTKFRWFQDADSGADYDHWGIDNVVIYCNDPTYQIVWQHDGYNLGPVGGTDPNAVAPHVTTNYVVTMSNGTNTCYDTVRIVVVNPTIVLNAGNDTVVCNGQCATLNATAKIIQKPAKTPTYRNQEQATISGAPGFPGFPPFIPATPGSALLNMDINITNLNQATVTNGYITSVCIGSLSMLLFAGIDIFDIWLVCPSGDSILLVKDSTLTGNNLTNTCFVPAGGNITSGASPYTGSFAPNQSFNNLTGCYANGVWSLHFQAIFYGFSLPTGFFNSWSISFNDPEISYVGNFSWNPTAGMTNPLTLTPTVCPPPTAYTLTVSDTAGCVTLSDVINVTTQSCCGLSAIISQVQPTCGGTNGSINVTPVPAGTYSYAWSDGPSVLQNRTGLGAGTYTVTITDVNIPTCTFDTTITLNSNSTLNVLLTNPINPTCAGSNGSITFSLNGGTAPYTITIDTNGTSFTINSPFPIPSTTINTVPAGAVNISVTDALGCTATANAVLTAPVSCCGFTVSAVLVQPTCGQSNGSVSLTPAGGSGNYTYAWGGGQSTSLITNVSAATYSVTITDNGFANCFIDTTFTLNSNSSLAVSLTNPVNPTCAGFDGSVTFSLSGGTTPYEIALDTNGNLLNFNSFVPIPATTINNLGPGQVNISVTDGLGCVVSANVVLVAPANCCSFNVTAVIAQPACAQTNGSIALTAVNGSGNYTYAWGGGQNTSILSNVGAGNYLVTITDNAYPNCFIDTTFALNSNSNLVLTLTNPISPTCGNSDGSFTFSISGGTAPYVLTADTNGALFTTLNSPVTTPATILANVPAGTFDVSLADANGCQSNATIIVAAPVCCTLQANVNVIPPSCGLSNASLVVLVTTAGIPPYTYSIDGINYQAQNIFSNVSTGSYDVITQDVNGCSDTINSIVPASINNLNVTTLVTNVTCFGANDGTATANPVGGNLPYSFVWSNAINTATISNLAIGNYSVTVSDLTNCTGSAVATITEPQALAVSLGNDTTLCIGLPVMLNAGSGYSTYLWSTNEITQTIVPTLAGIYSVIVTDVNGCSATDAVNVNFVPLPLLDLGEDKIAYEGTYVGLISLVNDGATTAGTYNWQPDTLLSCITCQNTVAYASDTISYTLTFTDTYGCAVTDNINLFVIPLGNVYWPNAFTPTGDGNNDLYLPFGSGVKQINWSIFNRWGEKVFESDNFFSGWDGTYKGSPVPMGVYVYSATAVKMDNTTKKYKGSVTLIR